MKNLIKTLLIITIISSIYSCTKDSEESLYHANYLGNWQFTTTETELNTDSIGYYKHDTVVYNGNIKLGVDKSKIVITYMQNNSITLDIDDNGTLSNFPSVHSGGKFIGNDNLQLDLSWGGLGAFVTHKVSGVKQ